MPLAKKPRPSLDVPSSASSSFPSPLPQSSSQQKAQITASPAAASAPPAPLPSHPTDQHKQNRFKIPIRETAPEVELGEKDLDTTAFPPNGLILTDDWNPKDEHANLGTSRTFLLENFSVLKNQTLVFKITVPLDSKRWSANIGPPEMASPQQQQQSSSGEEETWKNIFYHFNPRYAAKRKEFIQCDLNEGHWGVTDRRPFSAYSVLPTGNFMLMIQVLSLSLTVCLLS
jgi:hypothetical protein